MPFALPESISTPRLRLRRPGFADAGLIFDAYTRDAEVCRYMVWTPHTSPEETGGFIRHCIDAWDAGRARPYVLALPGDEHTPIGMLEARRRSHALDIGYVLARRHWGRGLMPEAVDAVARAALAQAGIFRIQASCDVDNLPSQRTLEKAGFVREGRLERYTVHPNIDPAPRPCFMYARVR
ncbi:GNAT family N-acetyltransferase [Xylophilus sp.]|uniref:GNAT family N-acetyltransferase n=1 Tax=Xylophilus sp. TaxID=2653893 RepID=UPI0013BD6CBC|nr:GNAT family protein [Xylophilus sp.]KAF1047751.1 MAG: hypothetical protein GAK38_01694 [Xylophilus sp.]